MSFAHSQASYAATWLNKTSKYEPHNKIMEEYVNKLNEAFVGLCTFSIENNMITVGNTLNEVIVKPAYSQEMQVLSWH